MQYRIATAICLLITGAVTLPGCPNSTEPATDSRTDADAQLYQRSHPMMGTNFQIQVISADAARAGDAIDAAFAEVDRVESLISEWRDDSELIEVNRRGADSLVQVGPELFEVVQRGVELSELTDGAFDITFAACGHLWSIADEKVPADEDVEDCLPRIDHDQVELDQTTRTITLADDDTQIGLGAIGKGYGVDRAARMLYEHGFENFVVDGGGDIYLAGRHVDRPWTVGIAHPRSSQQLLGNVTVSDRAVVTSGDYERYFEHDGSRYHHIIDPETGYPARDSASVTVLADDTTDADALATGLFVLGPDDGIELTDQLDGVEALIVAPDLSLHKSANFERYFTHAPRGSPQ